jgi:hypothetical protein
MEDTWITWTDNAGSRVGAWLRNVEAILEAPPETIEKEGVPITGIKLSCGVISWLNATYEEVERKVAIPGRHIDCLPRKVQEPVKNEYAPETKDTSFGFGAENG